MCALMLAAGATAAGVPAALSDSAHSAGGTARRADAVRDVTSRVVPVPASVTAGGGPFRITPATAVRVTDGSARTRQVADYLATLLRPATGYALPVTRVTGTSAGDAVVLSLGDPDTGLGAEGYRLRTTGRSV